MKNKRLHKWLVIMLVLVVPFLQNFFMCSASLPFGEPFPIRYPDETYLNADENVVTGIYHENEGDRAIVEDIWPERARNGEINLSLYGEFKEGGRWITGINYGALNKVMDYNEAHPEAPVTVECSKYHFAGRTFTEEEKKCLKFH